jgi:hypothetical protein
MYWLRNRYYTWAKKQGIELLRDDFVFIEKILTKLPESVHKSLMRDYADQWVLGMENKENSSPNQNMGRFKANTWLRRKLD